MSTPQQDVLDNMETVLNNISTANGYDTDVVLVIAGLLLETDEYTERDRQALIQVRYTGQNNTRQGALTSNRGIFSYELHASMMGVTHSNFMKFICDVEKTLGQDPHRGRPADEAYDIKDSYVTNITIVGGDQFDEVLGNSGRFQELIAVMEITVTVDYTPYLF